MFELIRQFTPAYILAVGGGFIGVQTITERPYLRHCGVSFADQTNLVYVVGYLFGKLQRSTSNPLLLDVNIARTATTKAAAATTARQHQLKMRTF
ncbi:hypothetical protein BsWGS_09791 [Bradybaena similaris]